MIDHKILLRKLPYFNLHCCLVILGDPGADSGGEGKSKRVEKYGTKKSKERREEPLETMSYQTSSKRSPPFWLLIGARKLLCFSAQSEVAEDAAWLGGLLFVTGLISVFPLGVIVVCI